MKTRMRYIGTRLSAYSAVMIALLVSALAVVTIVMHRADLMNHVRRHANLVSEVSQRSLYYSMLRYDRANIEKTISQIGKGEGIEIVRIFNKTGEIIYSADPRDVGQVVQTDAEGCVQCHASPTPVVELRPEDRSRIFKSGGRRSFGIVTPIYNETACSSDPCHRHPANQKVLGVLYMTVGLQDVDAEMQKTATLVAGFAITIIVVLSVFLYFYVRRFIRRPVAGLMQGVRRVAAGDLDHQIGIESRNEIGELALAFNQMTRDLKKARQEIEEWGLRMQDRVRERTAELEVAQAQLLQSQKLVSMGKLAASVAHEINNPLMGILTFIRTFQGWIRKGNFPPEKYEEFRSDIDIMGRETMRISKIVRNLLAFARRSKLERREHSINELLIQSLELVNHRLSMAEIDIDLRLDPHLPNLMVDAGQMQQTFMNLILNAAEAMGKSGTLTVSSAMRPDGKSIAVTIKDTGPGIPAEILDKLFDPFFTTKEEGQGTGLGLPVAHGIVHKHGGTIKVRTKVGEGSEFEVILPLSYEPPAEEETDQAMSEVT
jgi:two-component system NtrC family sensor kinase